MFTRTRTEVRCRRCQFRMSNPGAQRLCTGCVTELSRAEDPALARAFAAGDRVTVIQGVFAGHDMTVTHVGEYLVRARSVIMQIPLEIDFLPWQLEKPAPGAP
ncbi:MAG: hypothetical protein HUU15_17675 [Candidatus Brocadiae bacterium]|nr:hypothetical protein [Candidatus Brocadiia bacterium]